MSDRAFLGRLNATASNYLELIRDGLNFADLQSHLPKNARVFIKPNLTFPTYRPGVMTSPQAIEAAIVALLDYTSDIWIGDSDSGGYNQFAMEDVYAATGIVEFASRYGVKVVNLSRLERVTIDLPIRGRKRSVEMPRLLTEEVHMLITMPVPKIHMNTGVSLTFKNQWGCIPNPDDRLRLHPYFKEVVVAVNKAVRSRFAIIDGRYGLNRSGPLRGEAVALNWVCVANSIGTGARIATKLMQVDLEATDHLRYAESLGMVPDLSAIHLNQDLAPYVGPRFYLKRAWTDLPGLMAFRSSMLAQVAYFSPLSGFLHRLLYQFREPFYEYKAKTTKSSTGGQRHGADDKDR